MTPDEVSAKQASKKIDKELEKSRNEAQKEVKLLLLGAGDSGKSTVAKQMQILHLDGFSHDELMQQKPLVFFNIIDSCQKLLRAAKNLGIEIELSEEDVEYILDIDLIEDITIHGKTAEVAKALWADPGIQQTYARSSEFQLNDTAQHFFESIDRIASPTYLPDNNDMLRLRKKTTGVLETKFETKGLFFQLVDVGGQRNERKKWIHCFEKVTAIVFVVSLNEFDQKLEDDESMNRMHESLTLFGDIINNRWFQNTSIILFLNKKDLFAEKIKRVDLRCCFPDYKGGNDYDKATAYIEKQFLKKNGEVKTRFVYTHLTCATDTKNIEVVFNSVVDIFLSKLLNQVGF